MAGRHDRRSRADLERYMDTLADVRRAAVIICDSIRVRESGQRVSTENQAGGSSTRAHPVEDAPRCPICMLEFEDPTVVITVCGHGMHQSCAQTLMDMTCDGDDTVQVFLCPLCRASFRPEDVVLLIGVIPSMCQAKEWRTVQLTGLWRGSDDEGDEDGIGRGFRETVRKLYIRIQSLFRNVNEVGCAIGGILQRFQDATNFQTAALLRVEQENNRRSLQEARVRRELGRRSQSLDRRERRLLQLEYQNAAFVTQCVRAVKREERNNLKVLESIVGIQSQLEGASAELGRSQLQLQTTRQYLQIERDSYADVLRSVGQSVAYPAVGRTAHGVARATGAVETTQRGHTELTLGNEQNSSGGRDVAVNERARPVYRDMEVIDVEESPTLSIRRDDSQAISTFSNEGDENERNRRSRGRLSKRSRRNYRLE